jgi:hypothetical protein
MAARVIAAAANMNGLNDIVMCSGQPWKSPGDNSIGWPCGVRSAA